jgi:hypothetical protein
MFPGIRLMIATVAASVVALSCGFGVFAALRVNHQPLSRLPAATAPLQLVPDNLAPPPVLSGRPSPAGEPEVATTVADESAPVHESAQHDGGETQSSARSVAEPEALASDADEKAQAAVQPADPPAARSTALVADDPSSGAAEPEPTSTSEEGGDASKAQGATAVAAGGGEAKADKPAETTGEPAPITTPSVAALELAPANETAPAEQTTPVEQPALAEQPAPVDQSARADQSAREDQSTPVEHITPAAPTASPNELARLNLEDDAGDAADAAPTTAKKVVRKKHAKTRVAAKTPRKHRTRVAARFNTTDPMFGQPRFLSAPSAFQSAPGRMRRAFARRTPRASSAVGGPFVTTPLR